MAFEAFGQYKKDLTFEDNEKDRYHYAIWFGNLDMLNLKHELILEMIDDDDKNEQIINRLQTEFQNLTPKHQDDVDALIYENLIFTHIDVYSAYSPFSDFERRLFADIIPVAISRTDSEYWYKEIHNCIDQTFDKISITDITEEDCK